ncbi:MAG: hypothetical protein J0I18_03640, partial [Actinobacteria bacterium]|nr:hypothetical protein [Actinomycetota bacterium]
MAANVAMGAAHRGIRRELAPHPTRQRARFVTNRGIRGTNVDIRDESCAQPPTGGRRTLAANVAMGAAHRGIRDESRGRGAAPAGGGRR